MKYHFTNPHFRTCKSLFFRNPFLCKKSNKKNRPFLLRFQTLTHSKKGGDFCPSAMNLHPRICMCPFAWEKTTASLIRELNLYLENQKKKKNFFSTTTSSFKKETWEIEKREFKKMVRRKNENLALFILQDQKKIKRTFKYLGIRFLRGIENVKQQKFHLIYIDGFLFFQFLFLPRYDFQAWNNLMVRRSKIRFNHQEGWETFFYLIQRLYSWQFFPILHKKLLVPSILRWSYLYFAYVTLLPDYMARVFNCFLNISIFSNLVLFIKSFLQSFLFRWFLVSFILFYIARFSYFYRNPISKEKKEV